MIKISYFSPYIILDYNFIIECIYYSINLFIIAGIFYIYFYIFIIINLGCNYILYNYCLGRNLYNN